MESPNGELVTRIAELKRQATQAGFLAPSGPWVLGPEPRDFETMVPLWEGTKGADYATRDLNLIIPWLPDGPHLRFLEIGGGYGKLAKMLIAHLQEQGRTVNYVMVDAVPESLAYAEDAMAGLPCTVVPAWDFKPEPHVFNVCINIASMQEMDQRQVDHYIALLNAACRIGGIIVLMNSRDFYRRQFHYPANWRLLHKSYCHRSFTPNYPLEVFESCAQDVGPENLAKEAAFYRELEPRVSDCWRSLVQMRLERDEMVRERNLYLRRWRRRTLTHWLTLPTRQLAKRFRKRAAVSPVPGSALT